MIISIFLLISFAGLIVYMMRGGNLMIGFFIMAVLWCVIGLVPFPVAIKKVFTEPVLNYAPTIVYICFGSVFGRLLVDSGIAPAISEDTKKVGKNHPLLCAILVVIVTVLMFVSAYGVGTVIAIGVILLPILVSLGWPRDIAVSVYSMAIGSAGYLNIVLYKQVAVFFPKAEYGGKYLEFGVIGGVIQVIGIIIFLIVVHKKIDTSKVKDNLKAMEVDEVEQTTDAETKAAVKIPRISYLIPLIPVLLNMILKWDAIPTLTIGILLTLIASGKILHYKEIVKFLNASITRAIGDTAKLIMFLMTLVMFTGAAKVVSENFRPLIVSILPSNRLVLCLAIGILSPLALFRGPLHTWGAGAATAAVIAGTGIFADALLCPLLYIPTILAVSTDITQSWNIWGIEYTKIKPVQFMKNGLPVMWPVSIINALVVYFLFT